VYLAFLSDERHAIPADASLPRVFLVSDLESDAYIDQMVANLERVRAEAKARLSEN